MELFYPNDVYSLNCRGKIAMNCKKCKKAVPNFLKDNLDIDALRDFISHIESCDECREELTIELLIQEGLNSLESGNAFDLNKELNKRLDNATRNLKRRENLQWSYYILVGMVAVLFIIVLLLLMFI